MPEKKLVFTGCATALITPFDGDGIDWDALGALIDWQLAEGVDSLLIGGTTGESAVLDDAEKQALTGFAADRIGGRVPLIAGCGTNDTAHSVLLAKMACEAGADALLAVTPYYNKGTQEGFYRHFSAIADATSLPLLLYNVPSRTGCALGLETMLRLAAHPNICGVKEAGNDAAFALRIMEACGDALPLYCGSDSLNGAMLCGGARGIISVLSNLLPARCAVFCHRAAAGDFAFAMREQRALMELIDALFAQVNPIPVKTALAMQGRCREQFRLPLCELNDVERRSLRNTLLSFGLPAT